MNYVKKEVNLLKILFNAVSVEDAYTFIAGIN